MTEALSRARTVASYIPAKVRGVIYTVLGLAIALESIWGVVPEPIEAKVVATFSALGFTMAVLNTDMSKS